MLRGTSEPVNDVSINIYYVVEHTFLWATDKKIKKNHSLARSLNCSVAFATGYVTQSRRIFTFPFEYRDVK